MGKQVVLLWAVLVLCISVPVARSQSLWGYYPINENDVKDYSGNGHDATLVDGAAVVRDPERGWVLSFKEDPAQPSRATCGTDDPSAGGQLSVAAWLYWQGPNTYWQGIAGKSFSFDDRRWVMQLRDSDGFIQFGGADNANLHIFSTVAPATEEWQHVVGTCDGKNSKIYINGQVVGEGPGSFAAGAAGANVTLGFAEDRSDYDESFNGMLDEIYIFSRGLSSDQVVALADGVLPDFSKAREPNPADGDKVVMIALFRWTAGDNVASHNLYLGQTPDLGEEQLVAPALKSPPYYHVAGLEPGKQYWWRVDEVDKDGVVHTGDVWTFVAQALTAYEPQPIDGAIDAPPKVVLSWLGGQGAAKHHLYLSGSLDAVNNNEKIADRGILEETTFEPGDMGEARTFFWRVDEILIGDTVVTGPVWTFTTYVQIDDFEKYTDDEGNRIYETWIDGWVDGSSGSQVGYTDPPFAEQKIVHGGKQSMPFSYNNVDAPYFSECEMGFPGATDGRMYDINTLVIFIRGRLGNSPAPFYLGLKDAHGQVGLIPHPDPNIVTLSKWTEWDVLMPQFLMTGVDLTAVQKLFFGVGDKMNPNPAPGTAGLIYVDDIHAVKMPIDPNMFLQLGLDPNMLGLLGQ
jgi:hypothetical protein